jgi:YegS/Rv2252/BmrU family lipid kinase
MPVPRVALLYNPRSGKGNGVRLPSPPLIPLAGDPLATARAYLRVHLGYTVPEYPAETLPEITQAARQAVADSVQILLVAGGDGTLRAVAEVLLGTQTTLAILPTGTANVLAREIGIPLDKPERVVEIALMGRTLWLDVGRITVAGLPEDKERHPTRLFLLMCSVGLDAHAVAGVNFDLKELVGPSAYVISGLTTFATYSPVRYTITADDFPPEEYDAFSIVVSNAASYGGDFRLVADAEMDDGMLDVTVFAASSGPSPVQSAVFLRQAAAAALGRLDTDPDIRQFRSFHMRIESATPTVVQADGDVCGQTPLNIEILPAILPVRAPAILGQTA